MQPTTEVDPRIYGGEAPSDVQAPTIDPNNVSGRAVLAQPYEAPARVDPTTMGAGTSAVAEGQAAVQYAGRERASVTDSALAAAKSWSTTRLYDWITMPNFADDNTFDPKPLINAAPVQLTDDEHKFLAQSKSEDEYAYRLQNIQDQRKLYSQMGDHPIISGLVGMADPVYLAIDLASAGTASFATGALGASRGVGRAIAAAGSAGSALAVGAAEQQVAPVSDKEILLNALVNGAASATFFTVGKTGKGSFEKVDPTYPSDELANVANKARDTSVGIEPRVVAEQADVAGTTPTYTAQVATPANRGMLEDGLTPDYLARAGFSNVAPEATDAYTLLGKYSDHPEYGPMIQTLMDEQGDALASVKVREADHTGNRSAYFPDDHTVYLSRTPSGNGDAFTALHEAIHGLTSAKLAYGMANPGSAHGRIVRELESLRQTVYDHIASMKSQNPTLFPDAKGKPYFTTDLHEFVAGLFAGKADDFTKIMSQIPVQGSRNALAKIVDTVRKLMGIPPMQESALTKALGITDDLMRTKLDIKAPTGEAVASLSPHGSPQQIAQQVGGWWDRQGRNASERSGRSIEWSLHKEIRGKGTEGQRVADALVDDPINMTGNSAASQRQAIRSDFAAKQYAYEDALKEAMATQGMGLRQRIFRSGAAMQVQQRLERQVYDELMRRENAVRRGLPHRDSTVDPTITRLADLHDEATEAALTEMKAAGVRGADVIPGGPGYASRRWSVTKLEEMEGAFMRAGSTERQARRAVRGLIADGIQRANGMMPRDMAEDIAQAITERARNKGYFEDAANTGTMGDDGAQGIRTLLQGSGISPDRMQRIEEFLTGRKDDAGVMSSLKHRVDMDMTTGVTMPDGSRRTITDLVDTGVTRLLDGYLDDAAGQAALARKGLTDSSAITALRSDYLHGIADEAERRTAANLFDNTIKSLKGQPVGEEMSQGLRRLQAVTTSIGLANSGIWQVMEYANIAAKYGMVRTAREVLRSMPIARQLMGEVAGNAREADSLANVLSHNSSQNMRLRPFLQKLEDNHVIPVDDRLTLALQQTKQLVPYLNAMRYVHHNQANVTANLITDLVRRGAEGDAGARRTLALYGLEGHTLDTVGADIRAHGMTVDNWSDGTWAAVRGPLNKMMDDAVLRNRTGEVPAFAQFSTLGKFIFTFRSFMLGSHNKVLAGTLGRHGFAGLGLLAAYQFPLAMASSFAVSAMRGKPETDINKLASTAVSQMSAMGMLSELWGIASGDKQQFGASGLMAIDRLYKTGSQFAKGNFGGGASALAQSVPLLAILPGLKALAETAK